MEKRISVVGDGTLWQDDYKDSLVKDIVPGIVWFNTNKRGFCNSAFGPGKIFRDWDRHEIEIHHSKYDPFDRGKISNSWGTVFSCVILNFNRHPWHFVANGSIFYVRTIMLNISGSYMDDPYYPAVRYYEEEEGSKLLMVARTFRTIDQSTGGTWFDISWEEKSSEED